ncbi:unnamed protein product [Acanthoscelides obtectus]|uniref:Uncharacterized protein n=1 Tax=Acanthoscelides obtectus TaxID=200917 RepID=A0A9P0M1D6_ACAOB|nr:unnamed protein product [Acanthoscelides obtectus]CAK1635472.1 hypothetical protein AOBTE_LOCUS9290 [Acanthoscelides obtectus]
MRQFLRLIDNLIIQFLWTCHVLYNSWVTKGDMKLSPSREKPERYDIEHKRHFVHLFTTTTDEGRPLCYMDMYEMTSPADEERFREFFSGGVPNSTYFKYHRASSRPNLLCSDLLWM